MPRINMKLVWLSLISIICFSKGYTQLKEIPPTIKDSLKNRLETLFIEDQLFRRLHKDVEQKFGSESKEIEYFWKVVEQQDKRIEKEVIHIVENYGWLGVSDVGRLANTTLWLVFQHGSITSKKKYAPLLKSSVLKKESQPQHYARLIDRMLVNADKAQIYGSQTGIDETGTPFVYTIQEPQHVDQRRKEIGLGPIQETLKKRNIDWSYK